MRRRVIDANHSESMKLEYIGGTRFMPLEKNEKYHVNVYFDRYTREYTFKIYPRGRMYSSFTRTYKSLEEITKKWNGFPCRKLKYIGEDKEFFDGKKLVHGKRYLARCETYADEIYHPEITVITSENDMTYGTLFDAMEEWELVRKKS